MADFSTEVTLNNFPDWAVPMTKIVPVIEIPTGYEEVNPTVNSEIFSFWQRLGEDTYKLKITIFAAATYLNDDDDLINIPMSLTLDLIILNELNYYNHQQEQS